MRGNLHPIWYNVARQVGKLGTRAEGNTSIYTLQCLLLRLSVYDPSGEIAAASTILGPGEKYYPQFLFVMSDTTTQHYVANNQYLLVFSSKVDHMHRNLMLSVRKNMLERSLTSYLTEFGEGTSSAFFHDLVGVKISESKLTILEDYCNLLSMVDVHSCIVNHRYLSSLDASASFTKVVDELSRMAFIIIGNAATRHGLVRHFDKLSRANNDKIMFANAFLLLIALPRPTAPTLKIAVSSCDALESLSVVLLSCPSASLLSQHQYLADRNNAKNLLLAILPQLESDAPALWVSLKLVVMAVALSWLTLVVQERKEWSFFCPNHFITTCTLVLLHVSMVDMGSASALSSVRVIEAWVGAYLECVEGLFSSVVTDIKAGSTSFFAALHPSYDVLEQQ